ncbi:hypothetical protein [Sphingobacterium sp.]|uniref:hypothetical protein n=1 Tax=Sphingobacterium sp. TaxID=341027 RepID=UPI0031D05CC8
MRSLLSIFMLVFVLGCSKDGETGPQGPPGEKGAQGEKGISGQNGSTILSGKITPSTTVGVNGDFYLNLSNGDLYGPKTNDGWGNPINLKGPAGETGSPGSPGLPGAPGASILSGQVAPAASLGRVGDFYINLKEMTIYGPKVENNWGSPISLINGRDGNTILSGKGIPSLTIGANGDFYLNLSNGDLYGPKTSGSWGVPFNLKGPTGSTGAAGATILSGQVAPTISIGRVGDFYLNLKELTLYGPKTENSWGSPVSLKSDTENGVSVYVIKPDWDKNFVSVPNGNKWNYTSITDEYTIPGGITDTYFVTYAAASPGSVGLNANISLNQWKELVGEYSNKYYIFPLVGIGLRSLENVRIESNITTTGVNTTKFRFNVTGVDEGAGSSFRPYTLWVLVKSYKYQELKAKGIARENVERYLRIK